MQKINRLRKNREFQKVINSKNSIVSKNLVVYFIKNNMQQTRFGISISKKFINAVGRNKVRRQVREILDKLNYYNKSLDIVLIIRKPLINADFNTKLESITKSLQKV